MSSEAKDKRPWRGLSFKSKQRLTNVDNQPSPTIPYDELTFFSQAEAIKIDEELFSEYAYSVDQLMELAGLACAVAFTRTYPADKMNKGATVLVCCGPGNNGGDGLVCARHLKFFGYNPSVFYPKRPSKPLFENLTKQCQQLDIPFLLFLPDSSLISEAFNAVIDALFGFSFKGPVRGDFEDTLDKIRHVSIPIFSIDIPSGWDVEEGPQENSFQPDSLISLTAPKTCSKYFRGRQHWLGGRFLPPTLAAKYSVNLPPYPGTDCIVSLPLSPASATTPKTPTPNPNY